ncbi:uncharacterized protein LOC119085836 isoform X2 [Bradysia coprophila]|uniref:uncharacterized protein LOC119085836 isoform X2 n=1 Tax=Bradysia coprophila TaxID=38358 RepID=UPI00187DC7C8|nr:uncharacterized protein LOC119085836 isoform X2 [Bradysia coprophila]
MNPRKRKSTSGTSEGSRTKKKTKNQPKDDPSTLLTDVCSDCLAIIFDYLDIDDLTAVAQTCVRFKEVAANIFFRKFNNSIAERSHRGSKIVKLVKIRNILKSFGDEMCSLEASSIDAWQSDKPNDPRILQLIKKYFCGNIDDKVIASEGFQKELQLKEFHFDESMVEKANFVFARLSKLKLTKCKLLGGTEQLFANCANLTKLKLDFVHTNPAVVFEYVGRANGRRFNKYVTSANPDPCFDHCFPKLTSFSMKSITTASADDLDNFLSKNPQLKKLKIVECRQFNDVIQSVVDHVPHIEKLNVNAKCIRKKELLQLMQLNKLVIQFNKGKHENVYSALKGVARGGILLDTLRLIDFQPSEKLVKTLIEFKTLKRLELVVNSFPESSRSMLSEQLQQTEVTVVSAA